MYTALVYVTVAGKLYTPGEIIPFDPNAEWHLKMGAIKPTGQANTFGPHPEPTIAEAMEAAPEETPEATSEDGEDELPDLSFDEPIMAKKSKGGKKGGKKQ